MKSKYKKDNSFIFRIIHMQFLIIVKKYGKKENRVTFISNTYVEENEK